ncbi:hypothetical protein [Gilvibacter sediminis]|uniref:hypothetical protein n=1 Tax=Gilvibacter sediminis TaxID=379071 RepID=UPI0023506C0E|nr:hypothetical protein [Gilvibacter sediminis]MDC7998401.1 hypothetical protein [Gilvibacter sediminis]
MCFIAFQLEHASIIISILALFVSIIDRLANNHNNKTTMAKAEEAIKISQGAIEIEIRNSISSARTKVNDFGLEYQKTQNENPKKDLSYQKKFFYSIVEDFINQYDRACMLYLDNKIDKDRFRKEYKNEIINVVENKSYKKKYFNPDKPRFESLISVYQELK